MIYFGRMTRMKKTKSNLDELQELKLLKIEHNGCWLAFWGLLAVILTQIAIGNDSKQDLSGEWIVFMCLALYLTVGCIRNGIWDRKLKPNFKNNIMASSIAAVVMGILWFIISYRNYHKLVGSIATGVIMFISIEILFSSYRLLAYSFDLLNIVYEISFWLFPTIVESNCYSGKKSSKLTSPIIVVSKKFFFVWLLSR